jgi:aldose 1-epimerase
LHPEQGLAVTISARNNGPSRAPFGAGAHPYLATRGHPLADVTVRVPASDHLVVDERQVPVGVRSVARSEFDLRRGRRLRAQRLDDGFTGLATSDGRGQAEVRTKSGGARLWFDETYKFLQVYTLDELTPGQPGVAVEPMTCAADGFNSGKGLIILPPGGGWTGSWGIIPT